MIKLDEVTNLKAEMLCKGIVLDSEISSELDDSFVHGAVFKLSDNSIVDTSVWTWPESQDIVERSRLKPPAIKEHQGQILIKGSSGEVKAEVMELPKKVAEVSLADGQLGDYFSLHNPSTLFSVPVRQCIYIATSKPCTFCTFDNGTISCLSEQEFRSALKLVTSVNPEIDSIALGGGTPNLVDMGAKYYGSLAQEAIGHGLDCSIEMVPPTNLDDLTQMLDVGVSSLIMSIEVWDDGARSRWCLGKSSNNKDKYKRAYEVGQKSLGEGRVSSVLLVGTEPLESTYQGASELIELGVIPTLIPLRWYPASRFTDWKPVEVRDYVELAASVAGLLSANSLSPNSQPGCTACGGCSLEGQFVKLSTINLAHIVHLSSHLVLLRRVMKDPYQIVEQEYDAISEQINKSHLSTVEFSSQLESFCSDLEANTRLLNVGGTLNECDYFAQQGLKVEDVDISQKMLDYIANARLDVKLFKESITSFEQSVYAAVWAARSLIHVPPDDFDTALQSIFNLIKPDGKFGVIMFIYDGDKIIEQVLPQDIVDIPGLLYYRVLYPKNTLMEKIEDAGFVINETQESLDLDGDRCLYLECTKSKNGVE